MTLIDNLITLVQANGYWQWQSRVGDQLQFPLEGSVNVEAEKLLDESKSRKRTKEMKWESLSVVSCTSTNYHQLILHTQTLSDKM